MPEPEFDHKDEHGPSAHRLEGAQSKGEASRAQDPSSLANLQHWVGNAAVQRVLVQRSEEGGFDLDDETAARIGRERGAGQPLDEAAGQRMSAATGYDFSGVRVHTGPESDALNQQLGARAFTTGGDIFFREGAYQPGTSSGLELISHELTHVVQQGTGAASPAGPLSVNAPGDAFEQQAEAVSKTVTQGLGAGPIQRQVEEEEEDKHNLQHHELEDKDEETGGKG